MPLSLEITERKAMGYRSLNEVTNLLDQRDVKGAKACFHDEFMHLREADMLTIEEMYKHLDEFASGKCTSTNRVTHHDDEHSGTYSHVVTYNETMRGISAGSTAHIRLVLLKKDGLLWRQSMVLIKTHYP